MSGSYHQFRDYTFLGTTQSLCPKCLEVVPAKIIDRGGRVFFQKRCDEHGVREDFVCGDASWFDRLGYSLPGKLPQAFGLESSGACPTECGLCDQHEQHTCIGLLEITSACNLECPMCFAVSGPGGKHLSLRQCKQAIDRLVEVEGQPEILQLSGGEPTIHPEFEEILAYACEQPIDIVMINTNGVRVARDPSLVEMLARWRHRVEVYLQFDGFTEDCYRLLRGKSLAETKLKAIEVLGEANINTILVSTVQSGVNVDQVGAIVDFGVQRPWITGASFQPATYSGRYFLPEELEHRVTFPDILKSISTQTEGRWRETDFSPLPCAHPNAHTLAYAVRHQVAGESAKILPIARFLDLENHLDLLSGRITFNRPRAKELIVEYLSRQPCGFGGCDTTESESSPISELSKMKDLTAEDLELASGFFAQAINEDLQPRNMFRITTTSFMDAYNFDIRQLMKSCVHFILPTGHVIPFSAYNVLYRTGHIALPQLEHVATDGKSRCSVDHATA